MSRETDAQVTAVAISILRLLLRAVCLLFLWVVAVALIRSLMTDASPATIWGVAIAAAAVLFGYPLVRLAVRRFD